MENDKYVINKMMNIRETISNNYDEILNCLEKFKEELFIKDLRFSQLMEDISLIKAENEEKNGVIELLQEKCTEFSDELVDGSINSTYDDSQKSELYEGKLFIIEQIKQLNESCNADVENYLLSDLIHMFMKAIFDKEAQLEMLNTNSIHNIQEQNLQLKKEIDDHKEWQKHLEYDNEKLNTEIDLYKRNQNILISKNNEHNDLKEDYLKMQRICDELSEENAYLKVLVDECQNRLNEKEMECNDSNNLIKVLESNLTEQADKTEQANSMYNNEKEKCRKIECNIQQMIEEFTVQIHEKTIEIQSILDECSALKDYIENADGEIENLKHNIISLDYAIGEKNKIIKDLVKYKNEQKVLTTYSSKFNEPIQILHNLNQQMDKILHDLCFFKRRIINYENVLYNMQNTIQSQNKIKYLKAKQKNIQSIKHIKYQKFLINIIKERENFSLSYQKEIEFFKEEVENLKKEYSLKMTRLVDAEIRLKDEIFNLKEQLKLKNSQIIMTEKIANSQLKETYNIIQRLTATLNTKSLELNEVKNNSSEVHHHAKHVSTGINNNSKYQKIVCLIDLIQKLKSEKKKLQKVCHMREEKIKYLENACSTAKIKFK